MYTTYRVGVLSNEISKHSKISPPPSLRSHLTSSPMGILLGDYGTLSALIDLLVATVQAIAGSHHDLHIHYTCFHAIRVKRDLFYTHDYK